MMLYPLKFDPILKERLWGGNKLKEILEKPIQSKNTGESWELSGMDGDISVVSNGLLKGVSLGELIEKQGKDLLGKRVLERFGADFPILIKFIDAKQNLSVQLHPNDELALKRHNCMGKTEMWYVMDSDPGARLIVGFNKDVEKEEYRKSLEENTLLDLLNYEEVAEGDVFFINTGKIHAIGAGILLAEIQQTSDITYRVFDFNRKDKDGEYRELHTDLALDAIDYRKKDDFKIDYPKGADQTNTMVDCPYFKIHFMELTKNTAKDLAKRDTFTIYICLEGEASITNSGGSAALKKGETVLLPASTTTVHIATQGARLLEVTI